MTESTGDLLMSPVQYKNTIQTLNIFVKDVQLQLNPSNHQPLAAWHLKVTKEKGSTSDPDSIEWMHKIKDINDDLVVRDVTYDGGSVVTVSGVKSHQLLWADFRNLIEQYNLLVGWITEF